MSDVMKDLKKDHENVAHMLDLLDRELDALRDTDRQADFDLMHDIMVYMTQYPDDTHHPKEDLMFERMRPRAADVTRMIEDLEREHEALATKGTAFRDTLRKVVDGALVERGDLESAGRDYAEFLRYHMQKEDEHVFPVAERVLEPADWDAIAEAFAARRDPVFGPVAEAVFQSLREHIERESQ